MKKIVIYESDSCKVGTRCHMFDWKVGDDIITNGENSEIINIIDDSLLPQVNKIINHYNYQKNKIVSSINRSNLMNALNDSPFINETFKNFLKEFHGINVRRVSTLSTWQVEKVLNFFYEETIDKLMSV